MSKQNSYEKLEEEIKQLKSQCFSLLPNLAEEFKQLKSQFNSTLPVLEEELKQLKSQCSSVLPILEEEIKQLKPQYTAFLPVLNDFKNLKNNKKISNDQTSYSNLIISIIKEEFLQQLSDQNQSIKKQVNDLEFSLKSHEKKISSKNATLEGSIFVLTQTASVFDENISELKDHVKVFSNNFSEISKALDEKAGNTDVNELKLKSKQFAYQSEVDLISHEINLKAPREAIDKLQKKMIGFEDLIPSFLRKHQIEEIKNTVLAGTKSYLDLKFITQDDYSRFKDISTAKHLKYDEDIKAIITKLENNSRVAREGIAKLTKKLAKKPWIKEIERLEKDLIKYSKITELRSLETSLRTSIFRCEEKIEKYGKNIENYEQVLQRYDEILLEKSSKDDIKYLNKLISTLVKTDEFNEFCELNSKTAKENNTQFQETFSQFSSISSQISLLNSKIETLKKEHKDISNIAAILQSIREELQLKADKIDLHSILDIMGQKSELDRVIEKSEILQKQLELNATLNLTLCRTLVQSEGSVVQQRQDVFRKMNNLVSWINGSEPRVKSSLQGKATETKKQDVLLVRDCSLNHLPRTARNRSNRIKLRPKRYTPNLEFASFELSSNLTGTLL